MNGVVNQRNSGGMPSKLISTIMNCRPRIFESQRWTNPLFILVFFFVINFVWGLYDIYKASSNIRPDENEYSKKYRNKLVLQLIYRIVFFIAGVYAFTRFSSNSGYCMNDTNWNWLYYFFNRYTISVFIIYLIISYHLGYSYP